MKNMMAMLAVVAFAAPAFASKARVTALGGSRQINDLQFVFDRPYLLHTIGDSVTFEWGATADGSSPAAEGGFFKKYGESVYGMYLGRRSADFNTAVQTFNNVIPGSLEVLQEQNPINIFYGGKLNDISWGASIKYSNGKDTFTLEDTNTDQTFNRKSQTTGVSVGATNGTWEVELTQGLVGKSDVGDYGLESKSSTSLGVGYNVNENLHAYANYGMTEIDAKSNSQEIDPASNGQLPLDPANDFSATVERTRYSVGLINTLLKDESSNVFYGVAYSFDKVKDSTETTSLPVWLGVEAKATSWMTFRGSVRQNVLISSVKEGNETTETNTTTVAAGLGLQLGKGMLDATFTGVAAGQIDSDSLMSNVSYTFMF